MSKPLAIDIACGLGGWTEGLLLEGWDVIGFDVERHRCGSQQYPAQLVLQDILTLDGRQFRNRASLIVASPPCQRYSYMAMPWTRAKDLITWHRDPEHPERILELNALFNACLRIGREAGCPIVIENVRGAIPWVGRSRWNYGSFHLWGDVPALMPITLGRRAMKEGVAHRSGETNFHHSARRAHGTEDLRRLRSEGAALPSMLRGDDVRLPGVPGSGPVVPDVSRRASELEIAGRDGLKVPSDHGRRTDIGNGARFTSNEDRATKNSSGSWFNVAHSTTSGTNNNPARGDGNDGLKSPGGGAEGWFGSNPSPMRKHSSGSSARKAASARIAKIPLNLARHIARTYYPR